MKIAYIAHPVGGEVVGNIAKILAIVKTVNISDPETVPFVPYMADLLALDDNIPEHRERGIKNDVHLLKSGFIDEVHLYGDRISNGMRHEIEIANEMGIPVVPMTEQTKSQL